MSEQEELDAARVSVRDITAILRVAISVDSFQYDASIMEQPEFLISTLVVFQCQQFGGKQLQTQWRIFRTFDEFQGLDTQLRATFPLLMANIKPPRVHRRRTFFRVSKRKSFLARRCNELNEYLQRLLATSTMRLSRFLDPRAPLVLRCFCNFDAGFGRVLAFQTNQYESCVLCLDHVADDTIERKSVADRHALSQVADVDASVKSQEWELQQQQMLREQWRTERLRSGSRYDALEANLLDDRARNLTMCLKFECSCQYSSFHMTHNKMSRILQQHGYHQVYRPLEGGATALYCVLYRLQQFNDLDKRLHDALTGFPEKGDTTHEQLTRGVEILRHALANYGLLHTHALEVEFRMNAVDLKKKLHEFKSRHQHRVGAMELVLLATMLDLSIELITNDHDGTTQRIEPLSQDGMWTPIRLGGRIHLTLGYILPTIFNVNGFYLLAEPVAERSRAVGTVTDERSRPSSVVNLSDNESIVTGAAISESIVAAPAMLDLETRRRMWLGVEEMDRCLIEVIDAQMRSDLAWIGARFFDHDVAETLNKAILDAVWDDCQHNPNLFHLFQKQARQFGKSRTSAHFFFQYLEVAFGMEGAAYLVDFLLHVLPEEELRKQLLRARWFRVRRHLTKRVAPMHA
uniref:PX domain-containing protein n=1 Tax=Globisporangium ultimum (strain ATCC 200006 / CBS 805.95 / DAOM BR144) TaxID=431595 RepID=K3WDJ7_GLOUD